jgi:hypothetical protein
MYSQHNRRKLVAERNSVSIRGETTFHFLWEWQRAHKPVPNDFRSGVSLHSHTMFSEESLGTIPRYTSKVPYLGRAIERQQPEYGGKSGRDFDFSRAFWTPPLSPRQAYRLEEKQIQRQFQLPALVSLTDHDNMGAVGLLRVLTRFRDIPASIEWTIPFGPTFFHMGIHNISSGDFRSREAEMNSFTANPDPAALGAHLARLNSDPEVLIVLNHPLWDEKGIGSTLHRQVLRQFLEQHCRSIHALEINGLRSWNENQEVIALSRSISLPTISGGDRHGREPNAILNLSRASSFSGFVEEIRYQRSSHVVFMPQYREPLKARILQIMVDVVRDYPENIVGRRLWSDRVFYRDPISGETPSLTALWKDGGSKIVRRFIKAMRLLERRSLRSVVRLAFGNGPAFRSDSEASV